MNPTLDQIRDLNTQEREQMRRYSRNVLNRIIRRNRQAKNQYEQEQELEREQK